MEDSIQLIIKERPALMKDLVKSWLEFQTTIPVELRHKYAITEGTRLVALDTEQGIFLRKVESTLDLAGSGKTDVERVYELLDRMREADDR